MTKRVFSVILCILAALAAVSVLSACHPEKFTDAGKSMISDAEDYVISEIKEVVPTVPPTTEAPTIAEKTG